MWGLNALKAGWQQWRGKPAAASWPGVNLVGYATGGLGLGETLRRFAEVLEQHGLAHSVVDVDVNLGGRARELRLELEHAGGPNCGVVVRCFVCRGG